MMKMVRRVVAGFRGLWRRDRLSAELDAELSDYFESSVEQHLRSGRSREEAIRAARRALGNVAAVKDQVREVGWESLAESVWLDARYGARSLVRTPAFSATVVLTLSLAIGVTTAIFSLLDTILLKRLPVPDPDRLVLVGGPQYPVFQAFRQRTDIFDDLLATSGVTPLDVDTGDGRRERTQVSLVSGSYFSTLGVEAVLGRTFTREEDRIPGAHPIAVASYGYWQRRLAGDTNAPGRVLRVSGTPVTIVGVAPAGFFGEEVGMAPDLWMPLTMWGTVVPGRNLLESAGTGWLRLIGRVPAGTPTSGVHPELTALFRQVLTDIFGPNMSDDARRDIGNATISFRPAARGQSGLREQFARPLVLLMAAGVLVLLIACANIANLLLARSASRRREIDTRLALGMTRARLLRQLFTESLLLAGAGGVMGLAVAWLGREALLRLITADGSRPPVAVALDGRLLFVVAATSIATAIVFGFAPAWQSMRSSLAPSLGVRRDAGGSQQRLRAALIAAQVAVSLVLMMGAGLFLQTLSHLGAVDLGVAPRKLLVVETAPQRTGTVDERALVTARELQARIRAVPGVSAVAVSQHGVLSGTDNGTNLMRPEGFVAGKEGFPRSRWDVVGPGYFGAVGASLRFGRDFEGRDTAGSPPVVIVNQTMSRQFFGTDNAVGRRLTWDGSRFLEVVGVVADVNQRGPKSAPEPRFYLAYQQLPLVRPSWAVGGTKFIIRTDRDPAALAPELRKTVLSYGTELSVTGVTTGTELVERTLVGERMVTWLLVGFGVLALGLACLGVYGLIAYLVVQRTAEIGLRIALGAQRTDVLWLLLRGSLCWIGAGIALGAPLALAAARGAAALVFGVSPMDPATLAGAALVMVVMGIVAALIPSRRALNVDPLAALRVE